MQYSTVTKKHTWMQQVCQFACHTYASSDIFTIIKSNGYTQSVTSLCGYYDVIILIITLK